MLKIWINKRVMLIILSLLVVFMFIYENYLSYPSLNYCNIRGINIYKDNSIVDEISMDQITGNGNIQYNNKYRYSVLLDIYNTDEQKYHSLQIPKIRKINITNIQGQINATVLNKPLFENRNASNINYRIANHEKNYITVEVFLDYLSRELNTSGAVGTFEKFAVSNRIEIIGSRSRIHIPIISDITNSVVVNKDFMLFFRMKNDI